MIGKVGQKIVMDRTSKEVDRSNTNGNQGLYALLKLLFECNRDVQFDVFTPNDLGDKNWFDNACDMSNEFSERVRRVHYDAMVLIAGLAEYETSMSVVNKIVDARSHCDRIVLLSEDPRCLESMSGDLRFASFVPDVILAQYDGGMTYNGRFYGVTYTPLETAQCYVAPMMDPTYGREDLIVIANDASPYKRLEIVKALTDGVDCKVYGRADTWQILKFGDKHKGELKYDEITAITRGALASLCVPIRKGWVTSKYVEALLNGCMPVFHEDYAIDLLSVMRDEDLFIVNCADHLRHVMSIFKYNPDMVISTVRRLQRDLIEPYRSGALLSDAIMKEVLR